MSDRTQLVLSQSVKRCSSLSWIGFFVSSITGGILEWIFLLAFPAISTHLHRITLPDHLGKLSKSTLNVKLAYLHF